MDDSPAARLRKFRSSLDLEQKELALELGVSSPMISRAETGERQPSKGLLNKLYDRYGLSPAWIMHGSGDMYLERPIGTARKATVSLPDTSRPAHGDVALNGVDFQLVSRFDVEAGAGPGRLALAAETIDQIAFTRSWLLRLGVNGDLAGLIRVRGDSMAPHIRDGSLALVHFAEREVDNGQVYAFTFNEELFVKRLVKLGDGWLITSDNPAHQPRRLVGADASSLKVHGRVRAVISEY